MNDVRQEHERMVQQLVKDPSVIIETLTVNDLDLMHMALGLAGEISELDVAYDDGNMEKIILEAGDVEFYLQGIRRRFGLGYIEPITEDSRVNYIHLARIRALELVDLIKKLTINKNYKKFDDCIDQIRLLDRALAALYASMFIERDTILKANIKKLTKRYGGDLKYSDSAAAEKKDQL